MSASGASNYEYVTARVRARKATLFTDEDYRNLLRLGTDEIARFMEETTYDREINALGTRHSGVDLIEYALNENMARNFHDLLRWADGLLYDQIARYLRKFDAWNVKTILRGLYAGADRETIEDDLILAGEFAGDRIDELLDASDIPEVVDLLEGTIFGESLSGAVRDYEEHDLLVPLENAIDRAYYENLLGDMETDDRATALYVEFLEAEIDFRNLRNALRIARSGADIDPAEYFIEGGRLFDAAELQGLVGNTDELLERIRTSRYGTQLSGALEEFEDADSLLSFERALEGALLEYSGYLSNVYPLTVCPVLAYVLAKERERDNIRAIARGREAKLSPEEIEEELVIL